MSDSFPPGADPGAPRRAPGRPALRVERHAGDAPPDDGATSGERHRPPAAHGGAPMRAQDPTHGTPARAEEPAVGQAPSIEPGEKKRPRARRPFIILGIVAAVVLVLIGGYLVYMHGKEETDDAQIAADLVPVSARVPGQVLSVPVRDNQPVKKGDLLVQIDPAETQAKVLEAQAEMQTAKAQAAAAQAQVQIVEASSRGGFASAQAGVSGSSASVAAAAAQVSAARAGLARAQADARRAEADWKRATDLYRQSAIAKAAMDQAQAARDTALAGLQQGRAQLAAALEAERVAQQRVGEARGRLNQSTPVQAQIDAARANADLASARVTAAEAALDLASLQLSYTKIVAPADGIASKLSVHPGQLVQVGQPVLELVPSATYVVANFKETQIGEMKVGQRAVVHVDAYGSRDFEARVESLSGATGSVFSLLPPDNATGNYVKVVQRVPVRIAWVQQPHDVALKPGLSVEVTVYVQ